jgi:hypothetical protein
MVSGGTDRIVAGPGVSDRQYRNPGSHRCGGPQHNRTPQTG